jgi:hypothetical protein
MKFELATQKNSDYIAMCKTINKSHSGNCGHVNI